MKILLIDNGTKHLGRLKKLLSNNELNIYPFLSNYPPLDNYDLVILSGGGQISIASAPEVFREEIKLIKTTDKPIIGICEGCEMIAYAFGSRLTYTERKSKGLKTILPFKNKSLFGGLENLKVYEAHHWAITALGSELIGLAKSRTGYEVIKHKSKKIYGLQFHPEMFEDKAIGDELFGRIIIKIKGKVMKEME